MVAWKIVSASVVGPNHVQNDLPCDDAFWADSINNTLVAIASDGAGSARFGRIGSQHVVNVLSSSLGDFVRTGDVAESEFWVQLEDVVRNAINAAREGALNELTDHFPDEKSTGLADLHATVVGAVVCDKRGMFFHIGDGFAIAVARPEFSTQAVSQPENGEFLDTTYFFTEPHWGDHLRFTNFESAADIIAVMTDGASEFAVAKDHASVDTSYFAPVSNYLGSAAIDSQSASASLSANLSSPDAERINGDDKTLVWACWTNENDDN